MNAYFELADVVADKLGNKYYVVHGIEDTGQLFFRCRNLIQNSDRAWLEDSVKVSFIKHRWEVSPVLDLKEFMWIKLKCVQA